MEVKSRHHLRGDEIDEIRDAVRETLGVEIDGDAFEDVAFVESDERVVLVDGEPLVAFYDGRESQSDSRANRKSSSSEYGDPFLTVRGANAFPPERNVVTVDAGAVSFVSPSAGRMSRGRRWSATAGRWSSRYTTSATTCTGSRSEPTARFENERSGDGRWINDPAGYERF